MRFSKKGGIVMRKQKKAYPLNGKNLLGLSLMGWMSTGASSFMTSMFMLYLTDYSGIGAMAATLGTILLFAGRIVDAVDDPLQGVIMDSTRPTKYGKYKPYIFVSIIITAISLLALYCLPEFVSSKPVLTVIYVLFFYLVYDIGTSFFAQGPLMQTMSADNEIRGKLTVYPRVFGMLVAIPFAFILPIITAVNKSVQNMHDSFAIVTAAIVIPVAAISLIGTACVKEGKYEVKEEEEVKVKFKDIVKMFKTNKPLLISKLAGLFSGFVWTLIFATTTYYTKYRFCADLTTGAIDQDKFGQFTMIIGMMQMLPLMLGAIIGPMLIKKFKDPMKLSIGLNWIQAACLVVTFILHLTGLYEKNATAYVVLLGLTLFASGCAFVPGSLIGMECMDYGQWKTGKQMNGVVESVGKFIEKAQTALAQGSIGVILVAMGYVVDSKTDTYIGDLAALPKILDMFMVFSALLPAIFLVITNVISYFYPINAEVREQMKRDLHGDEA